MFLHTSPERNHNENTFLHVMKPDLTNGGCVLKSAVNMKPETTQDLFISTENIFPLPQRPPEDFSEVIFSSFRVVGMCFLLAEVSWGLVGIISWAHYFVILIFPVSLYVLLTHLSHHLESLWTMTSSCRTPTAMAPPTLIAMSGTVSPSFMATPPMRAGPPVTTAGCRWPSPRCLYQTCREAPDGFTVSQRVTVKPGCDLCLINLQFIDPLFIYLLPDL